MRVFQLRQTTRAQSRAARRAHLSSLCARNSLVLPGKAPGVVTNMWLALARLSTATATKTWKSMTALARVLLLLLLLALVQLQPVWRRRPNQLPLRLRLRLRVQAVAGHGNFKHVVARHHRLSPKKVQAVPAAQPRIIM